MRESVGLPGSIGEYEAPLIFHSSPTLFYVFPVSSSSSSAVKSFFIWSRQQDGKVLTNSHLGFSWRLYLHLIHEKAKKTHKKQPPPQKSANPCSPEEQVIANDRVGPRVKLEAARLLRLAHRFKKKNGLCFMKWWEIVWIKTCHKLGFDISFMKRLPDYFSMIYIIYLLNYNITKPWTNTFTSMHI